MAITKTEVERLEAETTIWDDGRGSVSGFGARRQRGLPVFVLKYRFEGRARWFTIGKFGSPWTVDNARNEAQRLLGLVAANIDPSRQRDDAKSKPKVLTVAALCDQYMEAAHGGLVLTRFRRPKKASTIAIDEGRVARHIKPLIGHLPLEELDAKVVRRMIQEITAGKTAVDEKTGVRGRAIVSGGAGTAARVADLLSGIMAWAVEEEYVETNPVHGVRRYRGEPKERHLSEDELRTLGRTLRLSTDSFHPYASKIVMLLALTGCRLNEIQSLQWSEFDVADSCLRLEDSKTGRSMRAIGAAASDLLKDHPRLISSPYVFPAQRGDGAYQGTKRQIGAIFKAAAITNASSHTLRHTFGSIASDLGYSDATIAGLLGHKGRGVTLRYVHRPDAALAAAAQAISKRVWQLLGDQGTA